MENVLPQSMIQPRVWRYAVLYFVMLIVALALLVGPIVAGSQISGLTKSTTIPLQLLQPTGQNNNDTRGRTETGTALGTNTASLPASSIAARMIHLY